MLLRNHGKRRRKATVDGYDSSKTQYTRARRKNITMEYDLEEPNNKNETNKDDRNRRKQIAINPLYKHITTIAHLCFIGVTIYIIYLCFTGKFELFTWHPLLSAIGWACLMTEAVLVLTKDYVISAKMSQTWRIRWHWILQVIGLSCCLIGFIIVIVNKNLKNKQHWKSWHGLLGLITMIITLAPTCLSGLIALFNFELRERITPKLNKLIHGVCGICSLILGGITVILGLYTNWFKKKTAGDVNIFTVCFICMCFVILWTLYKPCINCIRKTICIVSS